MAFENILVSTDGAVGLIQLNRPKVLNALNGGLMTELGDAVEEMDRNDAVQCIVVHGSERAFSAGADIDQMKSATPLVMLENSWINRNFDRLRRVTKPIIAAVSGYCLGGGCELAMTCDIIIASETAQFGQPEISIGIIPGGGGTQRLARAVGKSRAMEMILTGASIDAQTAARYGLVTRVVPAEATVDAALELASRIAALPPLAVRAAKAAILAADEAGLRAGLAGEREAFFRLFDTQDQAEGMAAFTEKRTPTWSGR